MQRESRFCGVLSVEGSSVHENRAPSPGSLWPRTLRAQLGLLLVLFWLVPIIALSGYTILVYRQNVASSLRNTMDSRLYYRRSFDQ